MSRRFYCSTVSILHQSIKGSTPFFFACQEGNLTSSSFWSGTAPTRDWKERHLALHMACYRGHLDVVTYLVVEAEVARGLQV